MNWKQVSLPEAYWFQEGPGVRNWQFTKSGIKLLNVGNITKLGTIDLDATDKYLSTDEIEKKYRHFLVDEGDMVIASSGISFDTDGLLRTRGAFVEKKHLPLCMNTSTIRFKAIDGISDLNFLKYWLDSNDFREQITRLVTGSAQQNFGPSHLKTINIPLPPIPEQRRIAAILGKADRLRHLRRTARQLGETYLQSVFVEMFGDSRKFEFAEFIDILSEDPKNGLYLPAEEYGSGTPIIRIDAFYDGVLGKPSLFKRVRATPKQLQEFGVENGDILINRVNSIEYLGKCAFVQGLTELTLFESNMMRIRINRRLAHPVYVTRFLTTQQAYSQILKNAKKAVNQASINQEDVKSFQIPIPPLVEQERFVIIVRHYERLKVQQRETERQAEMLFQSLLQRAFAGEV